MKALKQIWGRVRAFSLFVAMRYLIESAFENLGLIVTPLFPASLFGWSVHEYVMHQSEGNHALSLALAIVGAAAIESVGFWAFKAYMKTNLYMIPAAYLFVGIVGTVVLEWGDVQRVVINIIGFMMVAIFYWARAAWNEAVATEASKSKIEDWNLEQEALDRQEKREIASEKQRASIRVSEEKAMQKLKGERVSKQVAGSLSKQVANMVAMGRFNTVFSRLDAKKQTLIETLSQHPNATQKQLGAAIGASHTTAANHLKQLLEIGGGS